MDNFTYIEFLQKVKINNSIIIPLGAFEQHGKFAIMDTDYILAKYISCEVSKNTNIPTIPVLPYGRSEVHKSFCSIFFTDQTYMLVLRDIINSLLLYNIKNIFIINGHGGNIPIIEQTIMQVSKTDIKLNYYNWYECIDVKYFEKEHLSHAGSQEISALGAICKDYVKRNLVENMDKNTEFTGRKFTDIKQVTLNGVLGKADKYDENLGEIILKDCINNISKKIKDSLL